MSEDVVRIPGFGPGLPVHPRSILVANAKTDLMGLLLDFHQRHGLTSAEYTMLLADELATFGGRLVAIERRNK